MALKGIDNFVEQRVISGCRVAFDPRRTAEVEATRDTEKNLKRTERAARNLIRIESLLDRGTDQ